MFKGVKNLIMSYFVYEKGESNINYNYILTSNIDKINEYDTNNIISTNTKLFKNITLFYYLKIKIELYFMFDYKTITNSYINKYYNYLNNFKKNNPFFGRIIYKNNKHYVNTDYTF